MVIIQRYDDWNEKKKAYDQLEQQHEYSGHRVITYLMRGEQRYITCGVDLSCRVPRVPLVARNIKLTHYPTSPSAIVTAPEPATT